MRSRVLGPLEVSEIGLGCNNLGRGLDAVRSREVVHAALDAGVTFFDTADKYGGTRSEEYLGAALGSRRDDVVVATKVGLPVDDDPAHAGLSRRWIGEAVAASLRRLGTDRIDLYQVHRPDPATPVDQTLAAFDDLVRAGTVRAVGICNASPSQLHEYVTAADREGYRWFVAAQDELSLLRRRVEVDGVLDACVEAGLGFVPFYPLASGLLTGRYRRGEPAPAGSRLSLPAYADAHDDADLDRVELLRETAGRRGWQMGDVAVSWLLTRPAVASVVCGASTPEQAATNAEAGLLELDDEALRELEQHFPRPTNPEFDSSGKTLS